MNYKTKYLIAATLLGCSTLASAQSVKLASDFTYPPFNYMDEQRKPVGFDIEIADALCAQAKLECEWVVQDWDGLIPGLLARKFDVIMASMRITEDRKKKVLFTNKYYQTPARFVALEGKLDDVNSQSLSGLTIGVQRGTIHHNYVRDKYSDVATIKTYTGQDEVFNDLSQKRLDVIFGNSDQLALAFLEKDMGKGYQFVGEAVTDKAYIGEGTALALRQRDAELADKFNAAIEQIRANGTYQKIADKYFSFDIYGE